MAAGKFKRFDEFDPDELVEFERSGTIPRHPDPDEVEAAREAGWDLTNLDGKGRPRPVAGVEAEREEREKREAKCAEWGKMTVDDHLERIRGSQGD